MSVLLNDVARLRSELHDLDQHNFSSSELRAWKIKKIELSIELLKLEIMATYKLPQDRMGW